MAERIALRSMLHWQEPVFAPLVLNPLMAKLAERAGFPALCLGGGSLGYLNGFTEGEPVSDRNGTGGAGHSCCLSAAPDP